ncbi:phage holin family protein [Brevibacillus borstelensis]|uniref:phage holin family protein n=1 Tax=Brevibacillus borstelensis TaxID=45462 RepID=UPI00287F9781|nr:holin family protein [Brevibacillus borstelensis]WNF07285.1 holin family protein [Brevibacillus borstelensis]
MEGIFKTVVAFGGAAVSYLFGGWSTLLGVLAAFVVIDYVSGVIASGAEGKLKSKIGLIGIARKVFIFTMVAIAHLVDTTLGDQHFLRDATIFFYLANELLSIIENAGRVGLPVPEPIKRAVEVLKGKGDGRQ